jgi:hypothetical protein
MGKHGELRSCIPVESALVYSLMPRMVLWIYNLLERVDRNNWRRDTAGCGRSHRDVWQGLPVAPDNRHTEIHETKDSTEWKVILHLNPDFRTKPGRDIQHRQGRRRVMSMCWTAEATLSDGVSILERPNPNISTVSPLRI